MARLLGGWMIGRKVRTVLSFSWRDRWVLLQAWVLLLAVNLGLRVLPFPWVQRLVKLGRKRAGDRGAGGTPATVQRLAWIADVAGRNHLWQVRCLHRALALQWLLGRHGIATDLQIGVRKEADEISAHAWLTYAGYPIGEPPSIAEGFAPLIACGADR